MTDRLPLHLVVNGAARTCLAGHHQTLLDVLRDALGLTGTNEGCRTGECGACTVLLDGQAVPSCLVLSERARDRSVSTVEGLAEGGQLSPLQAAFMELGALQCGFCTPGMLITATSLLDESRGQPLLESDVRAALTGNLCRCTGYANIVAAILAAGEQGGGQA